VNFPYVPKHRLDRILLTITDRDSAAEQENRLALAQKPVRSCARPVVGAERAHSLTNNEQWDAVQQYGAPLRNGLAERAKKYREQAQHPLHHRIRETAIHVVLS
jgi:hypothetical protein